MDPWTALNKYDRLVLVEHVEDVHNVAQANVHSEVVNCMHRVVPALRKLRTLMGTLASFEQQLLSRFAVIEHLKQARCTRKEHASSRGVCRLKILEIQLLLALNLSV